MDSRLISRGGRIPFLAVIILAILAIGASVWALMVRSATTDEITVPKVPPQSATTEAVSARLADPLNPAASTASSPASPSTDPGAEPLQVAPVLPDTTSPALRRFLDPQEADRLPISFPTEVPAIEHPDEIAAVVALVNDNAESDVIRHQGIELLKRSTFPQLTDILLQRLADPNDGERFRAFVVQHLGTDLSEGAPDDYRRRAAALESCLTHGEPRVRREALGALTQVRHPQVVAIVSDTGWEDPLWQPQRDALIDGAVVLQARSVLPRIRPLLLDADTEVRIAALTAVGAFRDQESLALVEEATRSALPRVQRAATLALQRLTPQAAAPGSAPSPAIPDTATPAAAPDPTAPTTPE